MAETKNVYILRDVSADKVRTGKAEMEILLQLVQRQMESIR